MRKKLQQRNDSEGSDYLKIKTDLLRIRDNMNLRVHHIGVERKSMKMDDWNKAKQARKIRDGKRQLPNRRESPCRKQASCLYDKEEHIETVILKRRTEGIPPEQENGTVPAGDLPGEDSEG